MRKFIISLTSLLASTTALADVGTDDPWKFVLGELDALWRAA